MLPPGTSGSKRPIDEVYPNESVPASKTKRACVTA